jgi:hypothetical protein
MTSSGIIPRRRRQWIPYEWHLAHEYCYFLHDECARLLVEYEQVEAHAVSVTFADKRKAENFENLAKKGAIEAMRATGYAVEARKVVLNTIKMAMVSDTLHHLYEALQCMEKRKFVVAFNLLRKPLMDSLIYLSWMLADEDAFYQAFSSGDPDLLTNKKTGNIRREILADALAQTSVKGALSSETIHDLIFSSTEPDGLFQLFQHAVHLITVGRPEMQTTPENFNFIFKSPFEDDIFDLAYAALPIILLYLSHVLLELFDRMKSMEKGAKQGFLVRTILGFRLLGPAEEIKEVQDTLTEALSPNIQCERCSQQFVATRHNAVRALLTESFRCSKCRCINHLPLSYLFG